MNNQFGEVIVTRTFEHKNGKQVQLMIGKPIRGESGSEFECPFKFVGLGNEQIRWISGVDALQSLMLCMQRAAVFFEHQDDVNRGVVTWLGTGNLGLSMPA